MPTNKPGYIAKYNKENLKDIKIRLNRTKDADMIAHLESVENLTSYLKALILQDMSRAKKAD